MLFLSFVFVAGLQVRVTPQVAIAPAKVRITATIPADAKNRGFCIAAALEGNTVRRSCESLEGAEAPETYVIEWQEPLREGGEYVISLDVFEGDDVTKHVETPLRLS